MLIELTKTNDEGSLLRCRRADESVTWQRHDSARGSFFARHDLSHFAVETVLGLHDAFFGLIASGWEIAETTGKTAKGPLPDAALAIEHLVGMFDMERASGVPVTANEVNEYATAFAACFGREAPIKLSRETLERIRAEIALLDDRWREVSVGETLSLHFPERAR